MEKFVDIFSKKYNLNSLVCHHGRIAFLHPRLYGRKAVGSERVGFVPHHQAAATCNYRIGNGRYFLYITSCFCAAGRQAAIHRPADTTKRTANFFMIISV